MSELLDPSQSSRSSLAPELVSSVIRLQIPLHPVTQILRSTETRMIALAEAIDNSRPFPLNELDLIQIWVTAVPLLGRYDRYCLGSVITLAHTSQGNTTLEREPIAAYYVEKNGLIPTIASDLEHIQYIGNGIMKVSNLVQEISRYKREFHDEDPILRELTENMLNGLATVSELTTLAYITLRNKAAG